MQGLLNDQDLMIKNEMRLMEIDGNILKQFEIKGNTIKFQIDS